MQTNIERHRSHALVVTPEDLNAIAGLLAEHYKGLMFSASCSEGSKLTSADFAELLSYENPSFRRIESLTIRAGEVYGEGCSVAFGLLSFSTCHLSVSDHDDKRALKVADELGKRLDECKPLYSPLTRVTPMFFVMVLALSWCAFGVWHRVLTTGRFATSDVSIIELFYFLLPMLVIYGFAITYADRGWKWMFPNLWFAIGRQSKELEVRAKVRYWIFGVIILSIIVGVVGNLITNAITRP